MGEAQETDDEETVRQLLPPPRRFAIMPSQYFQIYIVMLKKNTNKP